MFASTVVGPIPLPAQQGVSGTMHASAQGGDARNARGEAANAETGAGRDTPRPTQADDNKRVTPGDKPTKPGAETLTEAELRQVEQMKVTDQEIRRHELAHQVAGGAYTGGASYSYERGPDGKRYVVAGEVPIDYGPVQGDPRATIDKMQQVISAALAPADPSPKDHQVAARARGYMMAAQLEMARQQGEMDGARREAQSAQSPVGSADTRQTSSDAPQRAAAPDRLQAERTAVAELSQYDIIARTANVGAQESLRSLA